MMSFPISCRHIWIMAMGIYIYMALRIILLSLSIFELDGPLCEGHQPVMENHRVRNTQFQAQDVQVSQMKLASSTKLIHCSRDDALSVIPHTAKSAGCIDCQNMTCKALLYSPRKASIFKIAQQWMKAHPISLPADDLFLNLTKNCNHFKHSSGYHTEAPTKEELNFPIAFNIIMHRDIVQVERLLRAIYRPQNEYCIHVDAKQQPVVLNAMKAIARCFSNVHIATKLERIVYAGFSRLQADLHCMKDLLYKRRTKWKYLINVAGQSFPLKTNLEMVQVLKVYNGSNDIEGMIGRKVHTSRFKKEWVEFNLNTSHPDIRQTGKKYIKPPHDIDIIKGSAYGIFSRSFVKFIIEDRIAHDLLGWSRNTYSPDEHYWATLHHIYINPQLKTPGGYPGKPNDKPWLAVYAVWKRTKDKCYGIWVHNICIFGVGDLQSLIQRREFFANKFYMSHEPFALDCMEQWLEYKVRCPPTFDRDFYQKLPFIPQNLRPRGTNEGRP